MANSNASAARASGKWCEKIAVIVLRLVFIRSIACWKSSAVAQLVPMTSISFSGKAPGRTLARCLLTCRPPRHPRPAPPSLWPRRHADLAGCLDDERRAVAVRPLADLGLRAGHVACSAPRRLARSRRSIGCTARPGRPRGSRPAPRPGRSARREHDHLLARLQPAAGQGVHRDRGGLMKAVAWARGRRPRTRYGPGPRAVAAGHRRCARRRAGTGGSVRAADPARVAAAARRRRRIATRSPCFMASALPGLSTSADTSWP